MSSTVIECRSVLLAWCPRNADKVIRCGSVYSQRWFYALRKWRGKVKASSGKGVLTTCFVGTLCAWRSFRTVFGQTPRTSAASLKVWYLSLSTASLETVTCGLPGRFSGFFSTPMGC